jgi:uncharacterized protein involved in cysteine biosynthesis
VFNDLLGAFVRGTARTFTPKNRTKTGLASAFAFALLVAAYGLVLAGVGTFGGPQYYTDVTGELNSVIDLLGLKSLLFMLALSSVLMHPISLIVASFFLCDLLECNEGGKHAPKGGWHGAGSQLAFKAIRLFVVANILGIGVFLLPLPVGPGYVYGLLNGFVFSRIFISMTSTQNVSLLGPSSLNDLKLRREAITFLAGIVFVVASSIPVINLVMPALAVFVFRQLSEELY